MNGASMLMTDFNVWCSTYCALLCAAPSVSGASLRYSRNLTSSR